MTGAAAPAGTARRATQRAERRAAILQATVRILNEEGLAAVTHRAIAREAGVPLAATTYYFSSKDELVGEALALRIDDELARIAERAQEMGAAMSSPTESAAALAELLFPDTNAKGGHLAQYEIYLEAARRPALRSVAQSWLTAYTDLARGALALAGAADPDRMAPVLVAGIDGILMHAMAEGVEGPDDVEQLQGRLEGLFKVLLDAD